MREARAWVGAWQTALRPISRAVLLAFVLQFLHPPTGWKPVDLDRAYSDVTMMALAFLAAIPGEIAFILEIEEENGFRLTNGIADLSAALSTPPAKGSRLT